MRELLGECLDALLMEGRRSGITLETIVVDNASSDGSAEVLRAREGVKLIESGRNLGYGRANNLGMVRGDGRYFLILNPDVVLLEGALAALLNFAEACPQAGIVSPRLLNKDGSLQRSAFRFPTLLMSAIDLFPLPMWVPGRLRRALLDSRLNGRYPQEGAAGEPFRVDHPLGACMLIPREAYRECGGFDPHIFMYSEEIDLAMRYAQAGRQAWQVPGARAVHLGGRSTGQVHPRMLLELWRSRLYLYRKHRSRPAYFALAGLLLLVQVGRALGAAAAWAAGRIDRREAWAALHRARALARLAFLR